MAVRSEAGFETWSKFGTGRRETVRYHEELYCSTPLGTSGTWRARPHSLVLDAIDLGREVGPAIAYDLGAGVGRHTIPMAKGLPAGWSVERRNVRRTSVTERRASMEYVLQSTLVQFIGRRPL